MLLRFVIPLICALGAPAWAQPSRIAPACDSTHCPDDCANNTCPDTFSAQSGITTHSGGLSQHAERRFVFTVDAPADLFVKADSGTNCTNNATAIRLERWDAGRNQAVTIASNAGGSAACSTLWMPVDPGDYQVVLAGDAGVALAHYDLTIDHRVRASRRGTFTGKVRAGAQDVYRLQWGGGVIDFDVSHGFGCTDLDHDLVLEVYDEWGTKIADNDDRLWPNLCPFLSTTLPRGRYDIVVRGFKLASAAEPYTMTISPAINPDLSLMVHDTRLLDGSGAFRMRDVFTILGGSPADGEQLFASIWNQQSAAQVKVNGFPYPPRPESQRANDNLDLYNLIAAVNRLDLMDEHALTCGEMRLIFARDNPNNIGNERLFLIFEAVMPNPTPGCHTGCQELANLWASLSALDIQQATAQQSVRDALRAIFIDGYQGPTHQYLPAVRAEHYGAPLTHNGIQVPGGQIRTNQFHSAGTWNLREFKVAKTMAGVSIHRAPVAATPAHERFVAATANAAFDTQLTSQAVALAGARMSHAVMQVDRVHWDADSEVNGPDFHTLSGMRLDAAIDSELAALGVPFTNGIAHPSPQQIINRVQANNTCAGCHHPVQFDLLGANALGPAARTPNSLGFVHVSEVLPARTATTFPISPALTQHFLPDRANALGELVGGHHGCLTFPSPPVLPAQPVLPGQPVLPAQPVPIDFTPAEIEANGDPELQALLEQAIVDATFVAPWPALRNGQVRPIH